MGKPRYDILALNFIGSAPEFNYLEEGFKQSVLANAGARLHIIRPLAPEKAKGCRYSYTVTNAKLRHWADEIQHIDRPTILMDVDLVVRKDLHDVFETMTDDIAFTVSDNSTWVNSGVVFVKPTDYAKYFLRQWADLDDQMYNSKIMNGMPKEVRKGHFKTGVLGMNQTSLAVLLSENKFDYNTVPASKYNCWYADWDKWDPETTAVIHVQMGLRKALLHELGHGQMNGQLARRKKRNQKIIDDIIKYF
ncbi:MAG: putative nucleotide-diphospho-sugar transferase [Bacteroidota bacterium]